MARPVVAIVGRPNVGKSTLFNKLVGKRLSIVDNTPGVTRDRIYGNCEWLGHNMLLVDTGGIEPFSDDVILSQMRRQAELAITSADVIIFVTDIRSGVVAADSEVASMLQKSGKPIILCVNKVDNIGALRPEFYEFYNLGRYLLFTDTQRGTFLMRSSKISLRAALTTRMKILLKLRLLVSQMSANPRL